MQWLLRTFTPPLIDFWRFLRAAGQAIRYRFIAVAVQSRIWVLEMGEAVRLVAKGGAKRR